MIRAERALVFCLLAGMAGCAFPASPQSHTDRATLTACRDYASRVYDERNRGDLYTINQTAAPASGSYIRDYGTNDLAAKYRNEQVVDDCVRNTGTQTNREDTASPAGAPLPTGAPLSPGAPPGKLPPPGAPPPPRTQP
jgi:hypothetical protein